MCQQDVHLPSSSQLSRGWGLGPQALQGVLPRVNPMNGGVGLLGVRQKLSPVG